jgi:phosphoglycerol transferase MdoB-like AlkP superfamily enzyme
MTDNGKPADSGSQPVAGSPGRVAGQSPASKVGRGIIPWDVAGRIGLLFVALCLIKLVMLAGFQKHLFETHWRVDEVLFHNWVSLLAFYIFIILIALNLWQFGNRCAVGGAGMVRTANLCVLGLGAAFILLTFQTGGKNYLISLFVGAQSWRVLFAAFFYEPPVWALWLLIYVLFYFLFARLGREHLVLRVTAVLAAIYTLLFLQDIKVLRNSLVAVDCLGVACLLGGAGSRKSLGWVWLVQPWVWLVGFIFFFMFHELKTLQVEFCVFSSLGILLLAGARALAWRGKFYPAWSWLLPFVSIAFLVFSNLNYHNWLNFQNLFCLGLTLPHYFLGELAVASVLLVAATLYKRFLPSASLAWLDGINLLLITLALADLRLTQIMGVRLDWQAIKFGADFTMVWRQARPYLPDSVFGLLLITGVYVILVGLWRRADAPQKTLHVGHGRRFLLIAFILLGLAGNWFINRDKAQSESAILLMKTSPLFNWAVNPIMDEKTFVERAQQLGMGQILEAPAVAPTRPPRDLNVVLIFQESSYNKHLSLFDGKTNTQPLLSEYKGRMELFPNFFSSFAASMEARFATLAGLYPVRDYEAFTFHRVDVKSLFEILHDNGYVSSVFYSSYFDYTGFRDFLRERGIDVMYDADTLPGRTNEPPVSWGVREGVTLKAIQSQIKQYAAGGHKFFLTYVPAAPHYPYDGIPTGFCKFTTTNEDNYVSKYQNELLYMDWVITSIVDELKHSGLLDKTLVIITDDHGEMLGENGGPIGHGWAVTPELANIPLIIMDPDHPGYHLNDTIGSQVDLLPTILDLLGIPTPAGQLYQGASLYSSTAKGNRKIYLNSMQEYAVIEKHHLLRGDRETETSTDINNSSFEVFAITNDGARTSFSEINASNVPPPSISQFDTFQENLLQNYAHYRQVIRSPLPAGN